MPRSNSLFLLAALILFGFHSTVANQSDDWEATISRLEGRATSISGTSRVPVPEAYAKLLEGQKHTWAAKRTRSAARANVAVRSARTALVAAVDADPRLAEGYTALAELEILRRLGETEVKNSIRLANLALKFDDTNFGARRVLGRLYSLRANLARGQLNRDNAELAVGEWREVTELDPRNTEAWAFLSVLYEKLGEQEKRIEALRKWVSSSGAIESQYYQFIVGVSEDLAPERASVRLASDLMTLGRINEALDVIAPVVSDQPNNSVAVNILRDLAERADEKQFEKAAEPLAQAVATDPSNVELANTLARLYKRRGMVERAESVFSRALLQISRGEKMVRTRILIGKGDLLASLGKYADAISAYSEALAGFGGNVGPGEQEVAREAARKMMLTARITGEPGRIANAFDTASKILGSSDVSLVLERAAHLRETGKRIEALAFIRAPGTRGTRTFELFRTEINLLVETGKIEEAIALIQSSTRTELSAAPSGQAGSNAQFLDRFTAALLTTGAYISAKMGPQALASAEEVASLARGNERRQLAAITKATALKLTGDRKAALDVLRTVLSESSSNPIALNNLGYYLLDDERSLDEGITFINRAVSIDPRNPSYLDSLGKAMLLKGDLQAAEGFLLEAVAIEPGSAAIWEHLGDLYRRKGQIEQAKAATARALQLAWHDDDKRRLTSFLK